MKAQRVKTVAINNRKKQLTVRYTNGKTVTVHYGQLGICKNIARALPDTETKQRAIRIEYQDGKVDFMPYDQPLALAKDPDYLLQHHLELLTARIRKRLSAKRVSLRYLAEQLKTSDSQVQRLLDPAQQNKNLRQLYRVAALLDLEIEFRLKPAA